jgi:hypothetical protein
MNRLKQDVLDSCEVGLAGKRVLEETIENVKENWPDPRRAKVVVRQLDAVAQSMGLQSTTMACKVGMAVALKHRMKTECQRPAEVASTPLRQITNFISKSTSAGATKKRAESTSMSRTDMDVVPRTTNRRKFRARVDHMAYVDHVHESYSNGLKLRWPHKHNGYIAIWFTIIP